MIMHDSASPHCSYCKHFESCFQVDRVIEWGYCTRKKVPPPEKLETIKKKVESGDYRTLASEGPSVGLFVSTSTDCRQFLDFYPF
jgi:hypothetical protein